MRLPSLLFISCFILLAHQQYLSNQYQHQETTWEKQQRLYIQDPYCIRWNGETCAQCSLRYYTQNQKCTPVNPMCNDFDNATGACLSCYPGYQISRGNCTVSEIQYPVGTLNQQRQSNPGNNQWGSFTPIQSVTSTQQYNSNPGCSSFDQTGKCLRCSNRQYNDSGTGNCKPVSDFCRTWNQFNGNCLTCYGGFELVNGGCFGNYNPGQPLTVRVGADSRSDQTMIMPLSQTQSYSVPNTPIYPQGSSIQSSSPPINQDNNLNYHSAPIQTQYQYQNQQNFPTPIFTQIDQTGDNSNYLNQISQLQPLPLH